MIKKSLFLMVLCIMALATSVAQAQSGSVCTQGDCLVENAIVKSTVSQTTIESTSSQTVVQQGGRWKARHYESITGQIIAVHQVPNGLKNVANRDDCFDPVKEDLIDAGDPFKNTRRNGGRFDDRWKRRDARTGKIIEICDAREVWINGVKWVIATKSNCGNERIMIRIGGKKVKWKIKVVREFRSFQEFLRFYVKWTTRTSTSTTTPHTALSYECKPGWTPINGGKQCKWCPPPECVKNGDAAPPTPGDAPGRNPDPSPNEPHPGGYACYSDSTGEPVEPEFYTSDGEPVCPTGSTGKPSRRQV